MRIAIVGPGAMGCLFAAHLARDRGNEVRLLDHNPRRARYLARQGLSVSGLTAIRVPRGRVAAACRALGSAPADAVIVLVKAYDTPAAARRARPCVGKDTLVVTLQNGLGNLEAIRRALGARLARNAVEGVTAQGATLLGWGRTRHAGRGETVLGAPSGRLAGQARRLAAALTAAGLPARVVRDARTRVWSKLVVNSAINPLGALLGVRNGDLVRHQGVKRLLCAVADESARVARRAGARVARRGLRARVVRICKATGGNFNSMLQDLRAGNRTEVDQINGAIVSTGARLGAPAPLNAALARSVKCCARRQVRSWSCGTYLSN
jgi:2-dehydropantoate 2-reductase